MSYRQPLRDVGVVKYSAIGEIADKAISGIDAARKEIITQQKEAQAILDEKFETINDEIATENILQLGGNISDKYAEYTRDIAGKEGLYNLSSQGYRDLRVNAGRIKTSVDKIAELASTNVELSKQFDDKDLASFVGAVRSGDFNNIDVEFKDGKVFYKYNSDSGTKTWSGDDIIKASGKFEDISVKRDEYNKNIASLSDPINKNVKSFLDQGKDYPAENLAVDINSAIKGVGSTTRSYVYNEIIPDSDKSGLPNAYSSNKDVNGRTLSTKEMAEANDAKNALIDKYLGDEFKKQLKKYPKVTQELSYAEKKAIEFQYAKELAKYDATIKKIPKNEMIPDSDLAERISNLSKNTSGLELKEAMVDASGFDLFSPGFFKVREFPSGEKAIDRGSVVKFISESKLVGEPILSGDNYSIISDIVPTSDGKALDIYGEVKYSEKDEKTETKREIIATIPLGGEGNLYPLIIAGRAKAGISKIKTPKENPMSRSEWIKTVPNGGDTSTEAFVKYRKSFND